MGTKPAMIRTALVFYTAVGEYDQAGYLEQGSPDASGSGTSGPDSPTRAQVEPEPERYG
jgi:hypothetical protein